MAFSRTQLASYVQQRAPKLGLDPQAVLAVASVEGLGGGIGDSGTSFGPWQLHQGGAYPSSAPQDPQAAQEWAWSRPGVDYALSRIATVAAGQRGSQAIDSIVTRFERPANPGAEFLAAQDAYGKPLALGGGGPNLTVQAPRPGTGGGGGSFWGGVWGTVTGAAGSVEHAASGAFSAVEGAAEDLITGPVAFLKAAAWLVNPVTWLRAVEGLFGFAIIVGGIFVAVGDSLPTETAEALAKMAE